MSRFSKDDANDLTTDPSNNSSYVWDARNQLSSVNSPNYTFTYDAVARREAFNNFGVLESYLYDALMAVQETSSNTQTVPTQNYFTMPSGEVLADSATVNGTTTTTAPLHDLVGSTIGLVNSAGSLATSFTYAPFGAVTSSGSPSSYPYLFVGMEYDGGTMLYHTYARYYSPRLQRYLSEDPLGFGGGDVNLFAYVGNDPVNGVDKLGTYCCYGPVNPDNPYGPGSCAWAIAHFITMGSATAGLPPGGLRRAIAAPAGVGSMGTAGIDRQQIVLAQADEEEGETRRPGEEENFGLPRPIAGVRGEPPRGPVNYEEYYFMRGVMRGFKVPKTDAIMEGKIDDPRFPEKEGWKKMQQTIRDSTGRSITIHYFEQNADPSTRTQFHFTTSPSYYHPDFFGPP